MEISKAPESQGVSKESTLRPMKSLILIPSSMALAVSSPQPSTDFKLSGIFPWNSHPLAAIAHRKLHLSLLYLAWAFIWGMLLDWASFSSLNLMLVFLHLGCGAICGSWQRKIFHSSMAYGMLIGTFQSRGSQADFLLALSILMLVFFLQLRSSKPSLAPQYEPIDHWRITLLGYAGIFSVIPYLKSQPAIISVMVIFIILSEKTANSIRSTT